MLKWTVGQKAGAPNTPSGVGPCYSIRRAAQKFSSRPRRTLDSATRRSRLANNKENQQCTTSNELLADPTSPPCSRDSIYMRLDSYPVALRDVSNHQTPPRSELRTPVRRRSSSQPRPRLRKSPCIASSPHRHKAVKRSRSATKRLPTPRHVLKTNSPDITKEISEVGSPERKKQPCSNSKHHSFMFPPSQSCSALNKKSWTQSHRDTLQIDYSPCPLRATHSLIALRKRLVDTFTLQSPLISIDNPLYFALNQSPSPSPIELNHKEIPLDRKLNPSDTPVFLRNLDKKFFEEIKFNFSSEQKTILNKTTEKHIKSPNKPCVINNRMKEQANSTCDVSPLARHLARLRLAAETNRTSSNKLEPIISPHLTCFPSVTQPTKSVNHIYNHDVTDPRFLDQRSMHQISENIYKQSKSLNETKNIQTDIVNISSTNILGINNLRCIASTNHDRNVLVNEINDRVNNLKISCQKESVNVNINVNMLNKDDTTRSKRQGIIFNEQTFALSTPPNSDTEERKSSSYTASIDVEAPSTLKRQQVIRRRRQRDQPLGNQDDDLPLSKRAARRPHLISCLTLPQGIPSPFNVFNIENLSEKNKNKRISKSMSQLGVNHGARKNIFSSQININKSPSFSSLVGLTLPEGIPSPPSPEGCSVGEDIPGIKPLESSAGRDLKSKSLWKRKDDTNSSNGSEDTWDSHQLQFLKTSKVMENQDIKDNTLAGEESSKINDEDDEDGFSSLASSSMVIGSPLALVEKQSRSRRCLLFTSPITNFSNKRQKLSHKGLSRTYSRDKGELDMKLYYSSGILNIHIIRGKNLYRPGGDTCNAYVKMSLVPAGSDKTFHRTCVRKDSNNPKFDHNFALALEDKDLCRRVLISAWHRDRGKRKSEFLGCMSFAVRHAVKKEITGSFRLLSQTCGRTQNVPTHATVSTDNTDVMANQAESSAEECISLAESDVPPTPDLDHRKQNSTKKEVDKTTNEDSIFLRHLELDPPVPETGPGRGTLKGSKGGRTPFTTTRRLARASGASFGFSIAWTHPPRIERVESGLPADKAGLRPGDYVIFVDKTNVVTLPEEEILKLIKSCGNCLSLEVYRKVSANGIGRSSIVGTIGLPQPPARSSTACSATTTATTSIELTKRRLHLPQVTFTSEGSPESSEEVRRQAVYQLLHKEQQYALCLQFGIARFLLPLAERRDVITSHEHNVLFQNAQELLRLTEDVLELLVLEEGEAFGNSVGKIYLRKMSAMNNAYRRYCTGLKKADCLLVEKTRNSNFMRILTDPPVPRRRPDLTTFLHKPLEHYRDMLKLLQTILNSTSTKDQDYPAISRVVQEYQVTYRDITVESGLMEPEGEGRPLLSLQDLESRLVFTRCKPFVLSSPGRQWIFGGDLSRVEGRSVRPFWALLFTDLLLFTKVSRDRVLFVTEEPLSLLTVSQALFSIRKKATEFRLMLSSTPAGVDSPAAGGCGPLPDLPLTRTPRKGSRRRTVALRAPTPELKAVWQNLIQRQIIYLNTGRGGTPASSPLDSPDPLTADSVATLDSLSLKRQIEGRPNSILDELIEHRCRQLGKSGANKGSALHLAQWMKGQLGTGPTDTLSPDTEPEPEVWSPAALKRRTQQLGGGGIRRNHPRNISRCEEIELSDNERSQSQCTEHSTSDSQNTVRSTPGNSERPLAVCRQCHKTCLVSNNNVTVDLKVENKKDENANPSAGGEFVDDTSWGPLSFLSSVLSPTDPFTPVPHISVLPPSPPMPHQVSLSNNNFWDDAELSATTDTTITPQNTNENEPELDDSDGENEEPPYRSLSPCGLRRFGTLSSLERIDGEDSDGDETGKEQEDLPADGVSTSASGGQLESVSQSLRGWTARAGSFVAEKMALFERFSEDSRAASFIDRYLRPLPDEALSEELAATSTSLAGEDECETSGGTSGEDIWGTPTSGDSELASSPTSDPFPECPIGTAADDAREALMMDELLGSVAVSNTPPNVTTRGFPQRRRLEPLVEDEEDSTESSSPDISECTKSYSTDQGNRSDSCVTRARSATTAANHGFFTRLRLRRSHSADSRNVKNNKLLQFLRSTKSEDHTHATSSGRLMRLFSRESTDDIPTSMPSQLAPQRPHDKNLERRFWKQLRKRRTSSGSVSPAT